MYTIMTVDDEPIEREALQTILNRKYKGQIHTIIEARNGKEAIQKAKDFKPDIILMDIGLPEVNGIEAQEEIISFLPNVQTIMLSAYSHFSYAQKAMQFRARDYLLKPVKTPNLLSAIDKVMEDLNQLPVVTGETASNLEANLHIKDVKSDIIKEAVLYMDNNFKEKIDLQSISNQIHLNPQYFSRLFKKEMGVSCIDYLNTLRVNYASKLLSSTTYPAYRIAMESGFTDPSYFCRIFTKYTQFTPLEYRKHYLKVASNA
ncbi:MAG: response regulator [Cellulosilyticaceae bacterium]